MGKFNIIKKLDLADIAEGAYLEFELITYRDSAKIRELGIKDGQNVVTENREKIEKATFDLLREKLVSGKLPSRESLVEVSPEDVEDLPVAVIERAISFLSGQQTLN